MFWADPYKQTRKAADPLILILIMGGHTRIYIFCERLQSWDMRAQSQTIFIIAKI